MSRKVEIGIISNDANHEETIFQIANRLDDLQEAASYIFQCIDQKIAGYSNRLSEVKQKANKLQDQLFYLQNNMSLKAVKMFSEAKYPAFTTYQEYITIMNNPKDKSITEDDEKIEIYNDEINKSRRPTIKADYYATELNLKEKLQFYYVMSKSLKKHLNLNEKNTSPAACVSSVSALLIDETPKQSYSISTSVNVAKPIEDAPDSIVQPWHSSDFESPSYLYAPTLGEVPQINVPAILPDLPGIVDDEKFVLDLSFQSPIAPSSAVTSPTSRIDLPDTGIAVKGDDKISNQIQDNPPNLPNLTEPEIENSSAQLSLPIPPPPPPPPVPNNVVTNLPVDQTRHLQTAATVIAVSLPPPPPPPPPPTSSGLSEKASDQKVETKPPLAPKSNTDDRSNLMEAIRAAGGIGKAKLRHTAAEKPNDRWSSASVGGDLMADLHAKLSMRRIAMSGGGGNITALERISRLIPPPPKLAETSDRNSASECDSQPDADDWEE